MPEKKLYHNKEWLREQYWGKNLSATQISSLCNVCHTTILQKMRMLDIPRRTDLEGRMLNPRPASHCDLTQELFEIIEGELLGDGCIAVPRSVKIPRSAPFTYSSVYKEYIDFIDNKLKSFNIMRTGDIRESLSKKSNNINYHYTSKRYYEFLPINQRWYDQERFKRVPRDIKLTPTVCRHWYIGDGSLRKRKPKKGKPYITIHTEGFCREDVLFLVGELVDVGFDARLKTRTPSYKKCLSQKSIKNDCGHTIYISSKSVKDFLKYIGSCETLCYQYKWNI